MPPGARKYWLLGAAIFHSWAVGWVRDVSPPGSQVIYPPLLGLPIGRSSSAFVKAVLSGSRPRICCNCLRAIGLATWLARRGVLQRGWRSSTAPTSGKILSMVAWQPLLTQAGTRGCLVEPM